VTYGGDPQQPWPVPAFAGLRDIVSSTAEIAAFVNRVLVATGTHQVDIVAHSEGSVAANYYLKRRGGAALVHQLISLGANRTGSYAFGAVTMRDYARRNGFGPVFEGSMNTICEACMQVLSGSPLLTELNSDGPYAPGVFYTNILTRYDEFVVPYTNGAVAAPNATNIVVQDGCDIDYSDHLSIAASRRAATIVLNALDPEHSSPVPCEFVAPMVG
jgi:triacylglycerol lipase